jgi:hypothetical protein
MSKGTLVVLEAGEMSPYGERTSGAVAGVRVRNAARDGAGDDHLLASRTLPLLPLPKRKAVR